MVHPTELNPTPSLLLLAIGGVLGTILLAALMNVAPAFGFPSMDVPLLIGGIFTTSETAAFWLGFAIFFFFGAFVFAPALSLAWMRLPGRGVGFGGAILKGALWGGVLWLLGGLALPLLAYVNRLQQVDNPGLFATGLGLMGAAGFFAGHLLYGIAVAVTSAMSRGIKPMDTVGWRGHGYGDVRDIVVEGDRRPGHHAAGEKPKAVRA